MGTKQTNDTTAAIAAIQAAKDEHAARQTAYQEAHAAEDAKRGSYGGTPLALSYATKTAEREMLLAEDAIEPARLAALAAGAGAPEEVDHPSRFGASELAAQLEQIVLRKLAAEEEISKCDEEAKFAIDAMKARREAAAARPDRSALLGAPGPVPAHMFRTLVLVERQRRSGKLDDRAIAQSAGWQTTMGGGDVPPQLVGKREELVRAAILEERPRAPRNKGRIESIDREIARLEDDAAHAEKQEAERKAKAEQARRAHEAQRESERRLEEDRLAKNRADWEKANRERQEHREAGRRILAGS